MRDAQGLKPSRVTRVHIYYLWSPLKSRERWYCNMEEENFKQKLYEMSLLSKFGRLLNTGMLPEQVMEHGIDTVVEALSPDVVLFFLKKDEILQLKSYRTCNPRFIPDIFPAHIVGECLCGMAAKQSIPVYCYDISIDTRCTWEECKKSGLSSFAALPLMSEKEVIGILGVASELRRDFEKQADFLEILSMNISIAFRNALLFQELKEHTFELEQEVSAKKQMEEILGKKEKQLMDITDNIPGVVCQFYANPDGTIGFSYVNERSEEILGLKNTPLNICFQIFTDCIAPDYRDLFLSSIKKSISEKCRWEFEGKFRKPSGEKLWIRGVSQPKQTGEQIVFNGLITDITEQKHKDELLRMNDARVSALLDMSRITGKDEHVLVDFALEKSIELTESKIGYLAFMNEDETVLSIRSWSGHVMEQCSTKDKPMEYPVENTGLWGECVRQRKAVITNDYMAENPLKKGYPEGHIVITSHMNIPLFDGDKIVIVAGVGNKEEPYDEEDIRQLTFMIDGMWKILKASRAEKSLRESEERYRFLVQNSSDIVTVVDKRGIINYVSPSIEFIAGYKPSELEGKDFFVFFHPDDLPKLQEIFRNNLNQHGVPISFDYRFRHISGHWLDFESTSVNFLRSPGINGILVNTRDITRRRKAERETEEWKNRYELLALLAGNVIYDYDLLTDTVIWGGSLKRTLGYELENIKCGSKHWKELIHPDEREKIFNQWTSAIETGSLFNVEYRFRHKKGHYILMQDTGYPLFDDNGKIIKYIGVLIDMTESGQLKEERENLEEQLRQAQKMESIGRLAGGVAHDFNNLLTPILCYAELLKYSIHPNDERSGQLKQIIDAAKKARDLTRQLLAFSRRQALQVKSVDLGQIVFGMEKLLRRTIRENIQLVISPSSSPCPVMADTGQVEQILMNLAVNAQDAMPDGGVMTIKVSQMELDRIACMGRPDAKPGLYGLLTVSDTGCGMDEETKKRIFEPFFSTKGEAGTGLGLDTVYGIVKQHQGNIWVYSEPGSGTCFKIFLPLSDVLRTESEQEPDIILAYRGIETVLLVEDDDVVRDIARAMLQQNGYQVIVASSGEQALKMIENKNASIDLLLTDVIMPGMNGKELYMKLLERHKDISVLFMSGYTDNIITNETVFDKDMQFIEKPFSLEGLTSMVRSVLDRKKQ